LNHKTANILETAGNTAKSPKFQSSAFYSVLQGMVIDFKLYQKNIFKIERYFYGSKNEFR